MAKLSLSEVTALALTNHFPLELIPGKTVRKGSVGHRFHCLVNHPQFPELSIVFGDEAHGYLFDHARVRSTDGNWIRVAEYAVRRFLNGDIPVGNWTRETPDSENPVLIGLSVLNPDLARVSGVGDVMDAEARRVRLMDHYGRRTKEITLVGDSPLSESTFVSFEGFYEYPYTVVEAKTE